MIRELVRITRTVRRFQEQRTLDPALLRQWIDCARLGGSARNAQVLKYMLLTEARQRQALFPLLGWAGYLAEWPGPAPGERPSAYMVCLQDKGLACGADKEVYCDLGIATQNFLLAAAEQGVFGCRIGAFSSQAVHRLLQLDDDYEVLLIIALGYPAEMVSLREVGPDGDIRYWRDQQGGHHVPKRPLAALLLDPPAF
ncbi:nitroreductase family protein [Desulfobulbus alkaliphilus]|nr:nitroreductase family protein [Desulfobulbus alkaliphilus]